MMRIWIVVFSLAVMSCTSIEPTPTAPPAALPPEASTDPSGSYVLKSIDGHALPMRPNDRDRPPGAGPGPLVVGGSLVIESGQARYVLDYRAAQGRDRAIRMNASLGREGSRLALVWPNGARTPVTFDGRLFIIDNIGMKLVFERQR